MSEMRKRAAEGLRAGDEFAVTRTFDRPETLAFGDMIRDFNPVHHDQRFAASKGFSGPVQHGLLTVGLICEIGGQLGWLATRMDFRFMKPVYAGDTITCRLVVGSVEEDNRACASAEYINQHGEKVAEALMEGIVPNREDRPILRGLIEGVDGTK